MSRPRSHWLYLGAFVLGASACADDGGGAGATPPGGTPANTGTPASAGTPAASGTPASTGTPANTGAPVNTGAPASSETPAGVGAVPVSAAFTTYEADDTNFQYSGRISFANPKKPDFSAPGVYITARFNGTAVAVLLEDEFKWGNNRSFFDVSIDGEFKPKIAPEMGVTRYLVADNLPAGDHDIVIAKRTEASIGRSKFLGLDVAGSLLAPPARPELKIEFIGDSITAGVGAEAVNGSPQCLEDAIAGAGGGWGQAYIDANKTYAAVAARELGAEYHLTAVSGIGLVRNYSSAYDARTMPQVYDLTFPEMIAGNTWDMSTWDTSAFVPAVIVVALGTNDFSPGDNPPTNPRPNMLVDDYVAAYEAFLGTLRADYPDAEIFAMSSPMLGNGWPKPTDTFADDLRAAVAQVASELNAGGDTKVHSFAITQLSGQGCGTHPNVAQHESLGRELAAEIEATLGL